ncbi:MAG: hypothetical protein WD738_20250 [Pirellulales bacterium]
MLPFRRQKAPHELGEDVPTVISELKARKHWKSLPPAVFQRFTDNANYVFDDSRATAVALRWLTFTLELKSFRGRLQEIASAECWSDELSTLSSNLHSFALAYEKAVISARNDRDYVGALLIVVRALTSSLVCNRYSLWSYTTLARISLTFRENREDAALWCARYRKAESDLLTVDESTLDDYTRAVRELLYPYKVRQTAKEMQRVLPKHSRLPKHLLDKYLPDLDSGPLTAREDVEQIEAMLGIQPVM